MLKLINLSVLLFFTLHLSAQGCPQGDITFDTQEEVDLFLQTYPDCKNIPGKVLIKKEVDNLQGLLGVTSINGGIELYCSRLKNFSGLDSLVSIGIGKTKTIGDTEYESFEEPSIFISYSDSLINFEGLSKLKIIEGSFFFRGNDKTTSFDGLLDLEHLGGMLYISGNDSLKNIDALSNLSQLGASTYSYGFTDFWSHYEWSNQSIYIRSNSRLKSIDGLSSIVNLEGSVNIGSNPTLEGSILPNLKNIGQQEYYESIFDYQTGEFVEKYIYTTLNISNNTNLSFCANTALCNIIENEEFVYFSDNGESCSKSEILDDCENYGKISHPVFFDKNENGLLDNEEPFLNAQKINIQPGNFSSLTNHETGGHVYLNLGSYTLSLDTTSLLLWNVTTDSIDYQINVDSLNFRDSIYFGIYPNTFVSKLSTAINSQVFRCNETTTFDIIASNLGTTITNGTLWFEADPSMLNVTYVDNPDLFIEPNLFGWNFSELHPNTSIKKQIKFQIPGPNDFPIGDPIINKSKVLFNDSNGTDSISYLYNQILECAYDPNDKLVGPTYPDNYALINEPLFYTIRFQNTGNAEAYDVVIFDQIDENLDINTFKLIGSSHPEVLSISINENKLIKFDFRDIFLPDSTTNFEESQGYISFMIQANSDVTDFTAIENDASIIFDQNPAIITNTTQNIMLHSFDSDEDGYEIWKDCDDMDPDIYEIYEEIVYDGIDNDCNPETLDDDLDQDGFLLADDCDDNNENINPNSEEIVYDGIDNDCNPETLDDDLDQDGFLLADDCDDNNENINPNSEEIVYDGIDNDCNSETLDDDLDQDGFLLADDCDDYNENINPEADELAYDGIDNDCNPESLDDDLDQDGFLFADDCDDMNAEINPEAIEIANNGIDEDCDGSDLVTGIKEIENLNIQFYPNPVTHTLSLKQIGPSISHYNIRLYDPTGKLAYQTEFFSELKTVNLSQIDAGFYFLNFENLNSGQQFSRKILVVGN